MVDTNFQSHVPLPGRIRLGVAGWSYPDWEGTVYPKPKPRGFDPLSFISRSMNLIEINSTFYHPGSEKNARSWAARVKANPEFRFTIKIWQKLTHERGTWSGSEVKEARLVPDLLAEAGVLGAVLIQYPWSFRNSEDNRRLMSKLIDELGGLPLAIEVRNRSWDRKEFHETLSERGAAVVNIDQPVIGESIKPAEVVSAGHAYVRFHGRNYKNWFKEGAGRDARYDYLYREDELTPWRDRILRMAGPSREVYVIFNNHFKGQAVANVMMLRSLLGQNPGKGESE